MDTLNDPFKSDSNSKKKSNPIKKERNGEIRLIQFRVAIRRKES